MSHGNLSGVSYTWGLYHELNPVYLNYVCALTGYEAPLLEGGFTYCELGCGNGVTLNALAAAHPQGKFVGIDLDPDHINNATEIAGEAGLDNTSFLAADIMDMSGHDLPEFDFIVMHGLYAWIDPDTREAVHKFVVERLKDGGVVYVSYNALPGWAALAPLRDAVLSHTMNMDQEPRIKAQSGLDYLTFLKSNNAAFFADNPPAAAFVDEIKNHDIAYVVHEFFAAEVKPFHFHQVAAAMRSLGLNFAGSTALNLNFIDIAVPAEFHEFLREAATRNEFESRGDFIRNQRFRKDVFVKGRASMSEDDRTAALASIPFGLTCTPENFQRSVRFGEVELNYAADVFDGLIAAMASGAKTVSEMSGMNGLSAYGPELLIDAVKFLTAGGQVHPFAHETEAATPPMLMAERYQLPAAVNIAHLKRRLFQSDSIGFAAPAAGLVLEISMADALYALCSVEAPRNEVADWAFQRLLEARQQIVTDGESETEAVAKSIDEFRLSRLGKFIELGLLAPV